MKTVVRLTEADLHRIVRESVSKILYEMDGAQYDQARQQHPKLMNKVDPLTFANRGFRGVNAQGRKRNDDSETMKKASVNAFNKQYQTSGDGSYKMGPDFNVHDESLNGDYTVRRTTDYDPMSDKYETEYTGSGVQKAGLPQFEKGSGAPKNMNRRSNEKARQMVSGDGPFKYNPNSGWK